MIEPPVHVQNDCGLKQLLRFDIAQAYVKGSEAVQEITALFAGESVSVTIDDILPVAEKAKWAIKAKFFSANSPPDLLLSGIPLCDKILAHIDSLQPDSDERKQKQVRAKVNIMAAKAYLVTNIDTPKIAELLDQLTAIKDANPDDYVVLKQYVRVLVDLQKSSDAMKLTFEQFEMKKWYESAKAGSEILAKKYGYKKCEAWVEMFQLNLCNYYLTCEEYSRLARKYLSKQADFRLQIFARLSLIDRLEALQDTEAKERHFRVLQSMLVEGDKYK